jgi:hypothetical protein
VPRGKRGCPTLVFLKKRGKTTFKPKVINDYNMNMGGVDLADTKIKTYEIGKNRLKRYYFKMVLHTLDIMCLNSHVLYKNDGGELSKLNFLLKVIE